MNEHWRAFDQAWFTQHQPILLWLLRTWPFSFVCRWLLRIRPCDVGYKGRIVRLLPNTYTVANADGSFTSDFRTHSKYAKRIYYALRPVWWAMHCWDALIADRFVPAWSFGFNVLVVSPQPNPAATACDGFTARTQVGGEAWATLIAGAGTSASSASANGPVNKVVSANTVDTWAEVNRGIFLFDTSVLISGVVISDAILSLFCTLKQDTLGALADADIYTSSPASNTTLAASDFQQLGSISQTGAPLAYNSWVDSAYNDFILNATGIGNITIKGITKFGVRNANYDVAATPPTWVTGFKASGVNVAFSDTAGTTQDPKLTITYTAPDVLWLFQ